MKHTLKVIVAIFTLMAFLTACGGNNSASQTGTAGNTVQSEDTGVTQNNGANESSMEQQQVRDPLTGWYRHGWVLVTLGWDTGMGAVVHDFLNLETNELMGISCYSASPFTSDGTAVIRDYGYDFNSSLIDTDGEIIVNYGRQIVYDFDEYNETICVNLEGKFGLIDKQGNYVIEPQFDYLVSFRGGNYAVAYNYVNEPIGDYYYEGDIQQYPPEDYDVFLVDKTGNRVADLPFGAYYPFGVNGLARYVSPEGLASFIDETGTLLPGEYSSVRRDYDDELMVVGQDGEYFYLDGSGNNPFGQTFQAARTFADNDLAAVRQNGAYSFIDRDGNAVLTLDSNYSNVRNFKNGYAMVSDGYSYGYVDETGAEVIGLQFDDATDFSAGGYAVIEIYNSFTDKYPAIIDTQGNVVAELRDSFLDVEFFYGDNPDGIDDTTGYMIMPTDASYGIIDSNGGLVRDNVYSVVVSHTLYHPDFDLRASYILSDVLRYVEDWEKYDEEEWE